MPQLHWEGQGWRHGGPDIALDSHNNPELRYYCHSTDEKPALAKVHDLPTRHMAILWQHRQPQPWSAWRALHTMLRVGSHIHRKHICEFEVWATVSPHWIYTFCHSVAHIFKCLLL